MMVLRSQRKRILARKEVEKELFKLLLVLLVQSEFVKGESVLLNTAWTSVLFSTCGRICFLILIPLSKSVSVVHEGVLFAC